jgi:hypothetical protein
MTATRRSRAWLGLVLAALMLAMVTSSGCNMLSIPFFLFGPEPKIQASLKKLASEERDKVVRVVVLVTNDHANSDFIRADRDLGNLIVAKLKDCFKYNEEKVEVVSASKVEEFKNRHDDWRTMPLDEIGNHFNADYVIDLEIAKLSLFEHGSYNQIYRGRSEISITVCDVKNPDEGAMSEEFSWIFPKDSAQGVHIDDQPKAKFRDEFYKAIATQIAWRFTSHPTSEDFHQK